MVETDLGGGCRGVTTLLVTFPRHTERVNKDLGLGVRTYALTPALWLGAGAGG